MDDRRPPDGTEKPAPSARFAARAVAALRNDGLRITAPRRGIVELLERADRPMTARQLHQALKARHVVLDLASVYRTVELLAARRLVHQLASDPGYIRCETGFEHGDCHHHLVCRLCRRVREFRCEGQDALAAEAGRSFDFAADAHAVEFVGVCARCRSAGTVSRAP